MNLVRAKRTGRAVPTNKNRRFSMEVEEAMDEFKEEFGDFSERLGDDLVDAIIERDIEETGDIRAAVRRVASERRGDELVLVLQSGAETGAEAGRRMASRRFSIDIDFEQVPERTINELNKFVDDISGDVLDTLGDDIGSNLEDWFEEGLSTDEITDRIQDEVVEGDLKEHVAERHARTVTQGASNRGNHSAMQDAPSVIGEEWVATDDARTRESHDFADGQITLVDTPFEVGGANLQHPGDPGGPIEEIANCRCTMVPVFESDLSQSELNQLRTIGRLN
jgi:hypothetical protein